LEIGNELISGIFSGHWSWKLVATCHFHRPDFRFPYRKGVVAFQKVGSRMPWNGLTSSHRLCDESGDESVADAIIKPFMWNCRNFTLFFNFRKGPEGVWKFAISRPPSGLQRVDPEMVFIFSVDSRRVDAISGLLRNPVTA
jgi:hypothetical protein